MGSLRSKINTKYKVVDLFCGVGGLSLGLNNTKRFQTIFANDVDADMCHAYSINFPDTEIKPETISSINFDKIAEKQEIDIVIGGPPCQAYSTSGKRSLSDPRANLFKEYFRAIKSLNPNIFVYENVKGIFSFKKGKLVGEIKDLFSSIGYDLSINLINAADYGVPQIRERVFVFGVKRGIKFSVPKKTHFNNPEKNKYLTVKDALSDLPRIKNNSSANFYLTKPKSRYQRLMRLKAPKQLMDHNSSKHGNNLTTFMKFLPEGGLKEDMPEGIRPKSGYKNSYARLWWKKPSTTVTRNFGTPSSARCIHPKVDRALTTREGARLQSFPDWFQFYGSRAKKNLQIGNAVPPILAEKLAESIVSSLDNI